MLVTQGNVTRMKHNQQPWTINLGINPKPSCVFQLTCDVVHTDKRASQNHKPTGHIILSSPEQLTQELPAILM